MVADETGANTNADWLVPSCYCQQHGCCWFHIVLYYRRPTMGRRALLWCACSSRQRQAMPILYALVAAGVLV